MTTVEKDLNIDLLGKFVRIIEHDKTRRTPVIKFIRQGFLLNLVQKFTKNRRRINFIGITGESASGKSTFVKTISKKIRSVEEKKNISLLNFVSTDNYFNDISEKIQKYGSFDNFLIQENYNPDAPESFQLDLMRSDFEKLAQKQNVYIPEYKIDGTGKSIPNAIFIETAPIMLTEGIAVFYPKVRDLFDIRFYVEVDDTTRLKRYIDRAVTCRHQSKEDALKQYERINESARIHLRPQRQYADVIINGNALISDIEEITEAFSRCF